MCILAEAFRAVPQDPKTSKRALGGLNPVIQVENSLGMPKEHDASDLCISNIFPGLGGGLNARNLEHRIQSTQNVFAFIDA